MTLPTRRQTVPVRIGHVTVGGGQPVVVQSMTNTDTADIEATALQVRALALAGSELVRVTVNTDEAAAAVPAIVERLAQFGVNVPIVGDFHFNGHKLLREHPACAEALAKYRINPGNVGRGSKRDPQFAEMIETACRYGKPVRIGVNWGSLDQDLLTRLMDENSSRPAPLDANDVMREAIVVSALESARRAEELGLPHDRIVISCKVSGVQDLISVYRNIAARCDYPLHLGLTEAGMGSKGIVASTAAMAVLLQEGIGDTIRVSLTPEPGGDRTREVIVAQEILQTMGLRPARASGRSHRSTSTARRVRPSRATASPRNSAISSSSTSNALTLRRPADDPTARPQLRGLPARHAADIPLAHRRVAAGALATVAPRCRAAGADMRFQVR